ncbi:Serine/Threonine-kinase/receptor R831, putative [Rhizoctonia solani AG-3 Rhs1AP]|uniref:Serine/Threonine-kinase/receptor R831, putative n=1 Tax=Rhizoctonia solani AG-3 Rhs1AP TaxID=1086054 RepID=X8J2L1_9AGAM|nr:Serine/Threonine-kinase/receptor R831, putative [Rhizoctonia solani AG-3 Rhs1AP]
MARVATTTAIQPLQLSRSDNVHRTNEPAKVDISPPPSYDLVSKASRPENGTFLASISENFDTKFDGGNGSVMPSNDRARRHLPEKAFPYDYYAPTTHEGSDFPQASSMSPTSQAFPASGSPAPYISVQLGSPQGPGVKSRDRRPGVDPTTLPTALCILQSLTVANKRNDRVETRRLVQEMVRLGEDDVQARKMVEAGAIPHLITQFQNLLSSGDEIHHVIMAIGILSHDILSAKSIIHSGMATQLMELSKGARADQVRACSAWCLGRMVQSDSIAAKFIEDGFPDLLINWLTMSHNKDARRYCAWALGTLARTDALAGKLVQKGAIPTLTSHLAETAIPEADPEDICVALFGVARLARTVKFSKALAAAGSVEPMVRTLQQSLDPDVLNWSARAIGCHMRPNSSDMAEILLWEGAAQGLAKLPRSIPPEETEALGSFAFAVARFSCAEWGPGTRKALVGAGVVDALLSALRAASAIPNTDPQVHAELAFAVCFLGDVGGAVIRKEIRDAGGVEILKQVARQVPFDVKKACETAITVLTGNVFARSRASAKTALAHDWSGGCPEYPIIHPDFESCP